MKTRTTEVWFEKPQKWPPSLTPLSVQAQKTSVVVSVGSNRERSRVLHECFPLAAL
jgi:hypothetical protein